MQLLSTEQMRSLDQYVINTLGMPGLLLMARAGMAVAQAALALLYRSPGPVVVLCGKGNNGGDGLVAARLLHDEGHPVQVVLPFAVDSLSPDAVTVYGRVIEGGVRVTPTVTDEELGGAAVIIDAMLGTGVSGPVRGELATLITRTNALRQGRGVIAVDVPSGVDADTGQLYGPALRAEETVTMALPKPGLLLYPGAALAGRWTVADIGVPPAVMADWPAVAEILDAAQVAAWLPDRPAVAHKGSVGWALLIAGSFGMTGAAAMAATAAYRAGAGLVRLALPASQVSALNAALPQVVCLPMPQTSGGTLGFRARARLCMDAAQVQATLIGPGLSRHPATQHLIRRLVVELPGPLVVDADALTAMAGHDELWQQRHAPTVITPHPGEMSRLLGRPVAALDADRLGAAREAAERCNAVVIFKGTPAIIATPEGRVYVNPTGTPALAVAGTGDMLAGMTVGLLAQGLTPLHAAALATYAGGMAATLLARDLGVRGLAALDFINAIPDALHALEEAKSG